MNGCFHCGEPIPAAANFRASADGAMRSFCCPGCLAVASLIERQGLARYYDFRSAPNLRPQGADPAWAVADRPEVARRLVTSIGPDRSELTCRVGGVTCGACVWLLERGLRGVDGVADVTVNPLSGETAVQFDPRKLRVRSILEAIARFGFSPQLTLAPRGAPRDAAAARDELKRLAVAGLGSMHVMTLAAALYVGAAKGMEASYASFMALASMLIATPTVLYAGAPFFRAAWADLARRRLGMDVPVALAIAVALAASLWNTLRGVEPVYFDSATMFVFFLTLGRFFESRARHKAGGLFDALADLRPLTANRIRDGVVERIGTFELAIGDHVVVAPGEAVPADGALVSDAGTFDEALLSGESAGRPKSRGDALLGGSLNAGGTPVEVEVAHLGADSYIERVGSLLHRALADRPPFLRIADRWAAWFIAAVLLLSIAAGAAWLAVDPQRSLEIVLALLVVTCPCALSLAAPTAFAVALGRLARHGLLLRSARVLERLGDVTTWLLDKTGTLTEGRIVVARVDTFTGVKAEECLAIAAALESSIEHPVARALRSERAAASAEAVEYRAGYGVSGTVAGRRFWLGSARHVGRDMEPDGEQCVYLADEQTLYARIVLADTVRPHAQEAVVALGAGGGELALVSGDEPSAVARVARDLGLSSYYASQSPADKLELLRARQRAGAVVAAIGDGINDAPLLAQADVSIALVAGSQLAQASADVVFTGSDLRVLARLPEWAAAVRRIVRQNLAWAALYNLTAVPLAATGVLTPWMAAIGMSVSSLLVVGNALRLNGLLAGDDPRTRRALPLRQLHAEAAT
jgi:Cu2+-exporting ATPase